jgi:prepilin-type N-terminal cleavage/methylation domain-containing protein
MIARGDRGRRGLSMIEVMIGIAVLSFVLLAFLSVIQSSATFSASSKQASIAAFQLQAALEATFALPFEDFKQIYNPALTPDVNDPDHPPDPSDNWAGHLGSRSNGPNPSLSPDLCQRVKAGVSNFTWRPVTGWVQEDDLPLLNQHMKITWVGQDPNPVVDWVEYRLTITWTNFKGKTQSESITTRRSR